jgi:MFS family permease
MSLNHWFRAAPVEHYGRVVLGTLAVTEIVSWGALVYAFPVVLPSMERELGWSRGELGGAFSLALGVSALTAPVVGRWLDARGPRALMSAGSLLACGSLLLWSAIEELWQLYAVFALVGLSMACVLYEPAFAVVSDWFAHSPRRALTVLTLFGGLASVIFTPATEALASAEGWRGALVALALLVLVATALPHAAFLRPRPPRHSGHGDPLGAGAQADRSVAQAVGGVAFWALTAALVLSSFVSMAIVVHLFPYLLGHGFAPGFAALAAGLVGGMQVPGRALLYLLGRWLPRRLLSTSIFGLQGLALLVLLEATGSAGVLLFVAGFGMSKGMVTLSRAALLAEFYGPTHYGTIGGLLALFIAGTQAVAPLGAGIMFDQFQSYRPLLWTLFALSALAALAASIAERTAPDVRSTGTSV